MGSGTGTAVTIGLRSSLCAASLALLSTCVAAAEICVKCSGPTANYDCVVNGSSAADTVTKLYCITALAKAGPHASCAIDRNSTAPCQGERKEFAIPTGLNGVLGGAPQQNATNQNIEPSAADVPGTSVTAVAPDSAEPASQKVPEDAVGNAPPKTVEEMMEKSAKSAGDSFAQTQKSAGDAAKSASTALGKAGSAVGNAAKTSWKCLSTFFSNC
jgi:hypothetical protein